MFSVSWGTFASDSSIKVPYKVFSKSGKRVSRGYLFTYFIYDLCFFFKSCSFLPTNYDK